MNSSRVPMLINPALQPALDALRWELIDRHYSAHAADRIVAHTAREGTPTGSPYLEAEDEAGASGAFIRNLPEVPFDSPAWDDESVILDARMLAGGTHPFPFAPISGGAPDDPGAPGPFEPAAEDLADYGRWSEELEARRRTAAYLDGFNAVRPDAD